jgi:hypothetical protein
MLASANGALNTLPGKAGETPCDAEDAAFEIVDVLAPHHDLRVALHFLAKAVVDGVEHGDRLFRHIDRPHDRGRRSA